MNSKLRPRSAGTAVTTELSAPGGCLRHPVFAWPGLLVVLFPL
jgi:hypothetical protein